MNDQQKQQVLQQIQDAKNVLVAVNANPTVDELAASIGLTLMLNKMDKHATTVFSGVVPSTIEFLQPEQTIETTTDSLRDFIIALDKSKADKLRYKVEDDVVRIFITPYKTSISDQDLNFSQGDFNVDVVVALGVTRREDLDKAITAHGRILHDATVVSLTNRDNVSELGSVHWQEQQASSLCEMVAAVASELQVPEFDGQMATALLTGIIAETDRFRNDKTTPLALSLSSQLMSAGANQQLIADKLEEPEPAPEPFHGAEEIPQEEATPVQKESAPGELEISHDDDKPAAEEEVEKIHIDEHGNLGAPAEEPKASQPEEAPSPSLPPVETQEEVTTSEPEPQADESTDALPTVHEADDAEDQPTLKQPDSSDTPMMTHGKTLQPISDDLGPDVPKSDKPFDLQEAMQEEAVPQQFQPSAPSQVPPPPPMPPQEQAVPSPTPDAAPAPAEDSLAALEESIGSPHAAPSMPPEPASEQTTAPPPPPMPPEPAADTPPAPQFPSPQEAGVDVTAQTPPAPADVEGARDAVDQAAAAQPPQFPSPQQALGSQPVNLEPPKPLTAQPEPQAEEQKTDENAPPPVPPPMTPQFYDADGSSTNPFLNPGK